MASFIPRRHHVTRTKSLHVISPIHLMAFFDAEINLLVQSNMGGSELNASFDQNKAIFICMGTCQGRVDSCPSCKSHDAVDRGKLGLFFFPIFNEAVHLN